MPKVFLSYARYIESVNNWLGRTVRWAILVILGVALIEIVSRYVFNSPTAWSLELQAFVWGFYFIIGSAWVLLRDEHVRMDALYHRWSPRRRAIFDVATFPLVAVYVIIYIRGGIDTALFSLRWGEISYSRWAPPLAPIKIIMVVGAVLLLLQAIAILIRDLNVLVGGKERGPRTQHEHTTS